MSWVFYWVHFNSKCDVRSIIKLFSAVSAFVRSASRSLPASPQSHAGTGRENFGSRWVELLAATPACWQELSQQDAGEQRKISPCFCKLANETLNKLLNSVPSVGLRGVVCLETFEILIGPSVLKTPSFHPRRCLYLSNTFGSFTGKSFL